MNYFKFRRGQIMAGSRELPMGANPTVEVVKEGNVARPKQPVYLSFVEFKRGMETSWRVVASGFYDSYEDESEAAKMADLHNGYYQPMWYYWTGNFGDLIIYDHMSEDILMLSPPMFEDMLESVNADEAKTVTESELTRFVPQTTAGQNAGGQGAELGKALELNEDPALEEAPTNMEAAPHTN